MAAPMPMPMPPAMAAPQPIQPAPAGDPMMKPGQPATPGQPPQAAPQGPPPSPATPVADHVQSMFDAPVPGQSLTTPPGNASYEHPPQFTDLHKALSYIWNQIISPQNMPVALAFMEKGVPPQMLADIALFTGFSNGKWTPDLAMLMHGPVIYMYSTIAFKAGIKNPPVFYSKDKTPVTLANIMSMPEFGQSKKTSDPLLTADAKPTTVSTPPKGFLSR